MRQNLSKASALLCSAWLLSAPLGCTGPGQFVWFSEMPANERSGGAGDYVIGIGDTISVRVFEQEGVSSDTKIRSDGKIALPFVGELVVAGKRPLEVSREIEVRLKEFIVAPRVTVNVVTSQPITVTVVGEVGRVGTVTLEPPARLVDALAQSGGPGEFADKSRIFVLRQFPSYRRIRFDWDALLRNEGGAAQFQLRSGDVVVIE